MNPPAPLQFETSLMLAAPQTAVFHALADHAHFCDFVPGMSRVLVDSSHACQPNGVGTIRTCYFGNDMLLEERIVLWQPPFSYGYSATAPNPFGLWNHLAVMECHPLQTQTKLIWKQYFEHDDLPAMLRLMHQTFDGVIGEIYGRFVMDSRLVDQANLNSLIHK